MSRWEPGGSGRLENAAMELYLERGFEQTTVADIAERAGLTERTFFRHFLDKREVIFGGQDEFQQMFVDAVTGAPDDATPLDAVAVALHVAAAQLEPRREWSRGRQRVIDANPALQERELVKLAGVAAVMATTLRERGVGEPDASLAAQSAMTVFRVAFGQWISGDETRSLRRLIDEALAALKGVTSGA